MTKRIILEKALELFTTKGYIGTSMDDIAKATGIRKASLYSHYSGKEEIFSAIFNDILTEYSSYISELSAVSPDRNAIERLKDLFASFIHYCQGNLKMSFWDRYFYYPPEFIKGFIIEKTDETQKYFIKSISRIVEDGIKKKEIKEQPVINAVLAYYYMMIGISMSVNLYETEMLDNDMTAAIDGLMAGFKV